jgi:hypothetical protein
MKTATLFLAGTALIVCGLGPALAGPCTTEIDSLTKTLSASDAGSGPTAPGGASGRAGGEHPPTAAMGKETQSRAASPEDVRRQTMGQPTVAETGRSAAAPEAMYKANEELARAREFDRQGKEAECMSSVRQARQFSGAK